MPGKSASFNNWRAIAVNVYYADGSVGSTKTELLESLPRSGVIAVNVYYDQTYPAGSGHPEGTTFRFKDTVVGDNFYFINPRNWREYDGIRRANQAPAGALVFEGVEVEKADFLRIYNRAYNDRSL